MAQCKFCGKEIVWTKEGRRFQALDVDGASHRCDEMKKSMESIKNIGRTSLSPEDIEKYEKAINANKGRK